MLRRSSLLAYVRKKAGMWDRSQLRFSELPLSFTPFHCQLMRGKETEHGEHWTSRDQNYGYHSKDMCACLVCSARFPNCQWRNGHYLQMKVFLFCLSQLLLPMPYMICWFSLGNQSKQPTEERLSASRLMIGMPHS